MKEKLYQKTIELTNGRWSSYLLQKLAKSALSKKMIPGYINLYDISMQEVSKNRDEFTNLHDFFTRELQTTARPIATQAHAVASPVDAKIEAFGTITSAQQFTVKGKPYTLTDLLGNEARAQNYAGGDYIVFYLSPADYHRIHSPLDAKVVRQYVLGNKSYPVNQMGLTYGKKPLSHNYRLITQLQTQNHKFCDVIKVGATFVNSIVLQNTSANWQKGEEVGYFSFGSTVIMLFEKGDIAFNENVVQGAKIRVGESFATML